jgi:cytochrome c oxidase cbb3-type subunit 3
MMARLSGLTLVMLVMLAFGSGAIAQEETGLNEQQIAAAAANYEQYCALCHGSERQGHVNDHAPSLRSRSLLGAGLQEISLAIGYGRAGTPMAGFFEEVGGPMSRREIYEMIGWLRQEAGVEENIELGLEMISGDIERGKKLYAETCAECHGASGEGITGTALGNPAMLSLTTDAFLKHAIVNGRDGTEMNAFAEELPEDDINSLVAFIRSRATGWEIQKPVFRAPPPAEAYVLNPDAQAPEWELKDELYVTSAQLDRALNDKRRLVLLDTRNLSLWQMANIEGSVPLPYYYDDPQDIFNDLPDDGTWIVTYCECPRAAAEYVNKKLKAGGFKNTAVLWEGIQGWVSLGYPVSRGETVAADTDNLRK